MKLQNDQKIFDRVEKKYLITAEQKQRMLPIVNQHMKKDDYYISDVFNIYFDTDNYDLIIQSIEQPKFKHKLRARSYGGYDKVFFEIKTKMRGKDYNIGYKRRVRITKKDYQKLIKGQTTVYKLMAKNADDQNDYQVAKEVDYLIEHYQLYPRILVEYRRESYQGDNRLRITFDEDLSYRIKNVSFRKFKKDKHYFNNEKNIIMEIKAQGVLPLWLVRKLSEEKIFPEQFSKVGKIYEKLRKEQNV